MIHSNLANNKALRNTHYFLLTSNGLLLAIWAVCLWRHLHFQCTFNHMARISAMVGGGLLCMSWYLLIYFGLSFLQFSALLAWFFYVSSVLLIGRLELNLTCAQRYSLIIVSFKIYYAEEIRTMKDLPKLAIVVPCYNEEAVLPETYQQLSAQLTDLIVDTRIAPTSYILFIDDGSQDNTWGLISTYQQQCTFIKGIKLSRNFGHQAALLCGLMAVADQIDCVISIDADLQDEITIMETFITQFQAGYDIVYGVRKSREKDTAFKKNTALAFYHLMKWLGTKLIANHADYRLISQRALKHLLEFNESSLFLRGIIPLLGFQSVRVYYNRQARFAGKAKYSLAKMLNFALNGITALTATPLRLINLIGVSSFLLASLLVIYSLGCKIVNYPIPNWLSIFILISLMGSIQLLSLGFIGEYLGKIYHETKNRPNYIIAHKKL